MPVVLAIAGGAELTDHEANGAAMLLTSIGTPAAVALASRLEPAANPQEIALTN